MSIYDLFLLWHPHAMTFLLFSWHFHSENLIYIHAVYVGFRYTNIIYLNDSQTEIKKTIFFDVLTLYIYIWKDINNILRINNIIYMYTFRYSEFYVNLNFPWSLPLPSSMGDFFHEKSFSWRAFLRNLWGGAVVHEGN